MYTELPELVFYIGGGVAGMLAALIPYGIWMFG
jgi:hypothetical protein